MASEPRHRPVAVDPAQRPWSTRRASRVLVVDERDRMLLFEDSDPLVPGSRWWMTPGGGIDPGESPIEAAVREIEEETGFVITGPELLGPIAHLVAVHGYGDKIVEQEEWFFLARVTSFEVDVAGHTEEEQLTMLGHRWWTVDELTATDDWIWPAALAELWALEPDRWPVELGRREQSTVPVQPAR